MIPPLTTLDAAPLCRSSTSFRGWLFARATEVTSDPLTGRYRSVTFDLPTKPDDVVVAFEQDDTHAEGVQVPILTLPFYARRAFQVRVDAVPSAGTLKISVLIFKRDGDCAEYGPIPLIELQY